MPTWLYEISSLRAALLLVGLAEFLSLVGLLLTRRYLIPKFHFGEGINDAISGTVQAIGVFYGITVGLIAVAVWNSNTSASNLVSGEATSIAGLYRDVNGYPSPIREELRGKLRQYTVFVITDAWPAQKKGQAPQGGVAAMDEFQHTLYSFEPASQGQMALHTETLRAYNNLIEYRNLRIDAVNSGLSQTMWAVIWLGAAISIGVAYFYRIEDVKLHAVLVILMAGFLALVLFMITINDKPFFGYSSIPSTPYQIILDNVIDKSK
ncbi:MAG TPA: hypothetical protein VHQ94_16065 [Pyrinomonadaceae bacterium]|nr:hypothetical protein [Pyrinomonadaceae bacterium]